jgi:hypothetical protein
MNHSELAHSLAAYERACALRSQESHEKAASIAAERDRTLAYWHGGPQAKALQARQYDAEIAAAERQARVHARRGEYARSGFVLSGPDEHNDVEWQQQHGSLIGSARSAGVLRHSDERID